MGSASPLPPQREPYALVYFLIGAERSGSTLLRLMMDHHPAIACLGEFNLAFEGLEPDGSEPPREVYHERLARSRAYRFSSFRIDPQLECSEAFHALLAGKYAESGKGKPIVGATLHLRFLEALRYWPEARFVHLVRDPRDVAPSVVAMGWSATCWHATQFWIESELAVEELARRVPPERLVRVRFEDLVARPDETLAGICRLLGTSYDPLMLTYPDHSTYPPPDASAAARWRRGMPARDVREVEARAGAMMRARGYEPSGLAPLRQHAWQRTTLALRNRWGRFRWRWQTYGAGPLFTHAFARRFGLKGLAERAMLRIQEIDQRNLR